MLPYSACIVKHFLPPQLYIFARALPFPRVLPYNRHMEFKYFKNMLVVSGVKPFDLEKCCTCGQAFRWVKNPVHMQAGLFDECGLPDAEASLAFAGVIRGRAVLVMQSDDSLIVTPCAKGEAQLLSIILTLNAIIPPLKPRLQPTKGFGYAFPVRRASRF